MLVTAGGDGSLVGIIMKAKSFGVDINRLICCPLPYGTGNDLCRVLNWGPEPNADFYSNVKDLVTEICTNTVEKYINIWTLIVRFQEGGEA